MHKRIFALFASFTITVLVTTIGCDMGRRQQANVANTEAQVRGLTEQLDRQTQKTGVYDRDAKVAAADAWGTPLAVNYARGGLAETVTVRSAGPDRQFHTGDDIVSTGTSMNLAGVGEGIKQNAEELAANAAKGAVRGTVAGVREAVQEQFATRTE